MSETKDSLNRLDDAFVHDPCPDGKAYDYLLQQHFPKLRVMPWRHGSTKINPDDFKDRRVGFFDCCPPSWDTLQALTKVAKSVVVVDHHDTNLRMVEGKKLAGLSTMFDMTQCGSVLLWKLLKDEPVPHWLQVIQLKDLGKDMSLEQEYEHLFLTHNVTSPEELGRRIQVLEKDEKEARAQGKVVYDQFDKEVAALWAKAVRHDWTVNDTTRSVTYVGIGTPAHISLIFKNYFLKQTKDPGADILGCVWPDTSLGMVNMGLRASEPNTVNLAKWVETVRKHYGQMVPSAGGHPKAAGIKFRCQGEPVLLNVPVHLSSK